MICSNNKCRKIIPDNMVIFVIPKNIDFTMTGKRTREQILCYDCAPATGKLGCYFMLAKTLKDI